jgi:hypothetical protein
MKPESRRRVIFAVAAAAIIVVAGGFGSYFVLAHLRNTGPSGVADGPTLYQAMAAMNQTLRNATGGPWGLFSVYGVAAQAPYSANVVGYPSNNLTVNACQAQFNGLTLWNGTMPVFSGTLNSGTAPFW